MRRFQWYVSQLEVLLVLLIKSIDMSWFVSFIGNISLIVRVDQGQAV